jgi:O-antigen ligase
MPLKYGTKSVFHFLFCLLLIGLPFSKAVASIAFSLLLVFSLFYFFQKKQIQTLRDNQLIFLPSLLFFSLLISQFYATDFQKGFKILLSQIDFIALPFIFFANRQLIIKKLPSYLNVFITATSIAAGITFFFFLLPSEMAKNLAQTIPLLKDYIIHEKQLAFGVYSPFTERLQFSYILVMALLFQIYLLFKAASTKTTSIYAMIHVAILLITLIILGARGAQIAFLMAAAIWIGGYFLSFLHPFLSKNKTPFFSYLLLGIGLCCFLFFVPLLAYKKVPAVKQRYDQMKWELGTFQDGTYKNHDYTHFTSIRRLLSWKNSWSLIKEHPFLGTGIGDYQLEMEKAYSQDGLGFPVNTQSQFLYYWAATGLLGLGSFLSVFAFLIFASFKKIGIANRLLFASFAVFYFIVFLFDAPLNFQVGNMTFLVFYGFLLLIFKMKNSDFCL